MSPSGRGQVSGLRHVWALFALVLMLFAGAGRADSPLVLDPENAPIDASRAAQALIAPVGGGAGWDARLGIDALVALPDLAFAPIRTPQIGFGQTDAVVHLRIPFRSTTQSDTPWKIAFNHPPWAMDAEVYMVLEAAPLPRAPIFALSSEAEPSELERLVATEIVVPAEASGVFYVSYTNYASAAPITFETPEGYDARRAFEDLAIYVTLGMLVGIALLALGLMGLLHRYLALYYATYLISVVLLLAAAIVPVTSIPGLPDRVFFVALDTLIFLAIASLLLFHRAYLSLDAQVSRRWLGAIRGAVGILFALNIGYTVGLLPPIAMHLWMAVAGAMGFVNAGIAVRRGMTGGWFFAAGWIGLALACAPEVLKPYISGYVTHPQTMGLFVGGIVFEAIALSVAMFTQVHAIQKQRERAMAAELDLTREKLASARRMAAAAHDIRQPLSSLRLALASPDGAGLEPDRVNRAIDYLEDIVETQIVTAKADMAPHDDAESDTVEAFPVALIFENMAAMFAEEAHGKGLSFRVVPSARLVQTEAFALMRIISNLMANAVRNTDTGGVLIGTRGRGAMVVIEIHDTGPGIDSEVPTRSEGEDGYHGHGLGLGIVRDLCRSHGLGFEARTRRGGGGTVCRVSVPKG